MLKYLRYISVWKMLKVLPFSSVVTHGGTGEFWKQKVGFFVKLWSLPARHGQVKLISVIHWSWKALRLVVSNQPPSPMHQSIEDQLIDYNNKKILPVNYFRRGGMNLWEWISGWGSCWRADPFYRQENRWRNYFRFHNRMDINSSFYSSILLARMFCSLCSI